MYERASLCSTSVKESNGIIWDGKENGVLNERAQRGRGWRGGEGEEKGRHIGEGEGKRAGGQTAMNVRPEFLNFIVNNQRQ